MKTLNGQIAEAEAEMDAGQCGVSPAPATTP